MSVNKVEDDMRVEQNNVYVIPSGVTMTIESGVLKLHKRTAPQKPIDEFLSSLALE